MNQSGRYSILIRCILIICVVTGLMGAMGAPLYGLITVSTSADSGAGSLRQAVLDAAVGEEIQFSVTGTITLTSGQIQISQNLTITGPGTANLTIDGNNNSRIFYVSAGTVNISGVTLDNGNSASYGGAIENEGTLNLTNCVITNCDANGIGNGYGGAIDNYGGTVTLQDCTLSGNTATDDGGAIRNEGGTVNVTNCTINGNTASGAGGGIQAYSGTLNVTNSTISGNNATDGGGGIADSNGTPAPTITIVQCTITNNTSTSGGGGLDLGTITANMKNTILAANTGGGSNNLHTAGAGALNSQGYNLCDAALAAFSGTGDQTGATLNIGVLANNDGSTQTHALLAGSDAIDQIPEGGNSYNGAPTYDQRGHDRTGANRDVGAYEYQGKPQISGNAGVASATLSYNDGGPQTATADGSGNYSFFVSYNWSGTVTPSRTGYTFTPTSNSYTNVQVHQDNEDYTANSAHIISGTVTDGSNPIQNVTITFSHDSHTETTDASGNYSYGVAPGTNTTITPSHAGYSGWSPANIPLTNVTSDQSGQDFTGTINTYTISGTVTDGSNPIQGVTITFSHDSHTESTDASGNYSYTVPYGTSTTITPTHAGYSGWTPANRTVNSISTNVSGQNFTGTINTYTISGNVTDGSNPIQGVTITFSHDSHTESTDASGNYSYTVPWNTTTTVTPSHAGYAGWTPANRPLSNIAANQTNQNFTGTPNNYTISGTVTDGSNPIQNVTITFSHDSHTETTDASGNYSYTVPYNTTTTVTPSHAGYSGWTPANRPLSNIAANQTNQNFTATINTYTISGTVTDGSNPIQGVTITFSHDSHTESTDASGNYSYTVPWNTTTTVTPSHAGYSGWTPANRPLSNIAANQTGQDFTGTINNYTISGTVTDGSNPIQGVTITFSHDSHTETTDASGNYSYSVPYNTTTTVTPSHAGYAGWTPANRPLSNIAANQTNQNFTGTPNTYTISGTVTDGSNPIQGVTITFSHDSHTETTDASGNYSYAVPYNTTTTVTPSHVGYSGWTPANIPLSNIAANQPNQNFTGTINNFTISGTVTDGSNPIQGVTITFSHDSHTETTDASGNYSYSVPYNTTTTVTPSHVGYAGWTPANRPLSNIAANQTNQNFTGTPNTYTISGTVTDGSNPVQGVTITFSHDSHTETTDASGNYSYAVPYNTTTTVTPSHAGYSGWTPANIPLSNVTADQPNQNFTCTINTYTVSGTVTDGTNPIQGVTITFSHDSHTETTDASGNYSYTVPYNTTTTITPTHAGYASWTPANIPLSNISADQPNQNFTGTINTYTISGTVTDGSSPVQGVTITFSHDSHTETTDASGNYSYAVPYNTTTTVTPSHAGFASWTPANIPISTIAADLPNQDFTGTPNTYTISGTVTDGTNPVQGVTITFSHDSHTETTDASGNYSYSVPYNTTTTITPTHAGYTSWTPATRTVTNIAADQPGQDFVGNTNSYSISGTVTDGTNPIQGVTITFSHDSHTETTDAGGNYSYAVPYGTTTTLTPSHASYTTWTPATRTVTNIAANEPGQDFVGSGNIETYTISGTVTDGTTPIEDVTITFSHDGKTKKTDASGNYSYAVPAGTTTTITPSFAGYTTWTPATRTVTDIAADQPGQDFVGSGAVETVTISGTVTDGTDPIQDVTITFSHDGNTETTDASGNYSYAVPSGTTTTVTPSKTGYSFTPAEYSYTNLTEDKPDQDFTASQSMMSVTITQPSDGDTVSGAVIVNAVVSNSGAGITGDSADIQAISKVVFYIDGIMVKEDKRAPYQCRWETQIGANGNHTVKAVAHHSGGDTANHQITVNVNNSLEPPHISANRDRLNFCVIKDETQTGAQRLLVSNSGGGILDWSAAVSDDWLEITPANGGNYTQTAVQVNGNDLPLGTYMGTITISDPGADNSPVTVDVYLEVKSKNKEKKPKGHIDSPLGGAVVYGNVAITGWAIDDSDVSSVKIYRNSKQAQDGDSANNLVYIGDAVFVEDARPDIEALYGEYPRQFRGGWGYMMLSNFLPNNGNGNFTITAIATDNSGNEKNLGSRTIHVDNTNAVKPFGDIDTPAQGGDAFGAEFINWGWALTPLPNTIPTDGSTIRVWVDGEPLWGNPDYDIYRADIAGRFPGYNNSNGAVGLYYLDTTLYANGVHSIAWSVTDNAGNIDGIGSRFFQVINVENRNSTFTYRSMANLGNTNLQDVYPSSAPLYIKKGYDTAAPPVLQPDVKGVSQVELMEDQRLQLNLAEGDAQQGARYMGFLLTAKGLRPLPLGSKLDIQKGIFYWQPGPGFMGDYRLVFITKEITGHMRKKVVNVTITHKFK